MFQTFLLILLPLFNFIHSDNHLEPHIEVKRYSKLELMANFPDYKDQGDITDINFLSLENFPIEKKINVFIIRPLLGKKIWKLHEELIINENNLVLYKSIDRSQLKQFRYYSLPTNLFFQGEKIYLKFVTLDKSFEYQFSFIPNPLEYKNSKGNVMMSAQLNNFVPGSEWYRILLNDIPEDELLNVEAVFGDEVVKYDIKYSSQPLIYQPGNGSQNGGFGKITITRENKEMMTLNVPWGEEILNVILDRLKNI